VLFPSERTTAAEMLAALEREMRADPRFEYGSTRLSVLNLKPRAGSRGLLSLGERCCSVDGLLGIVPTPEPTAIPAISVELLDRAPIRRAGGTARVANAAALPPRRSYGAGQRCRRSAFLSRAGPVKPTRAPNWPPRCALFSIRRSGRRRPAAGPMRFHRPLSVAEAELNFDDRACRRNPARVFEQWFRELDAEAVTLVFASAYLNNPASLFGHTLLRLDRRGQTEQTRLLAYAVNYAADDSNSTPDVRGGWNHRRVPRQVRHPALLPAGPHLQRSGKPRHLGIPTESSRAACGDCWNTSGNCAASVRLLLFPGKLRLATADLAGSRRSDVGG
jgi:hypothetical protein